MGTDTKTIFLVGTYAVTKRTVEKIVVTEILVGKISVTEVVTNTDAHRRYEFLNRAHYWSLDTI